MGMCELAGRIGEQFRPQGRHVPPLISTGPTCCNGGFVDGTVVDYTNLQPESQLG